MNFSTYSMALPLLLQSRQALLPNHTEVAFWKEVSAPKLVSEIGFSLGYVNCLASTGPCALWIRILIDAHTGISIVAVQSSLMGLSPKYQ